MEINATFQNVSFCFQVDCSESKTTMNTVLILVLVLCIIGNCSVCLLVARHYQLHTVTNAYIVNMAVAHLLPALCCIPLLLRFLNVWSAKAEHWLCTVYAFAFVFYGALSSLSLTLITLDRHCVIKTAGRNKLSARTAKKSIWGSWLFSLALSSTWVFVCNQYNHGFKSFRKEHVLICAPLLTPANDQNTRIANALYVTLVFLLPSSYKLIAFVRIWKPIWSGSHHIRPLGGGHPGSIRFAAEIRTTRTMLFVLIFYYICWGPYFITSLYNIVNHMDNQFIWNAYNIFTSLAFGNCCVCPLLYALRNPRVSLILARKKRLQKREQPIRRFNSEMSVSQPYYIHWANSRTSASMFDKSDGTITTHISS